MNFQEIYKKIKAIDEGQQPVEECGGPMDMIAGAMQHPEQPDSVSMNVSMNASGTGGIRDLMSVLHAIEQGATGDDEGGDVEIISTEPAGLEINAEPHISMDGPEHGSEHGHEQGPAHELETAEEYQNEPQPAYQDQEYMNQDLAGGADEPQQMHRGGYRNVDNPMAMEGLKSKLQSLYTEIKEGGYYDASNNAAAQQLAPTPPVKGSAQSQANLQAAMAKPNDFSAIKSSPEWKQLQANLEAAMNSTDAGAIARIDKASADIRAFVAKMGMNK